MRLGILILAYLATTVVCNEVHDQFSSTSRGSRHADGGSIFAGFVVGPLLFICAIVCIWYNQKRAAIDTRRLKLASQICQDVDVTSKASAMHQNGKLVYAYGQTRTNVPIFDQLSRVGGPNLIKITRSVQVLQWRRHTRRQNEHDVEYYQLQWASSNSQNQGTHHNSAANWFINNDVIYNSQVYIGGYNLDKRTQELCQRALPFNPTMDNAQAILMNTQRSDRQPSLTGQYIYFTPGNAGGYGGGFGGNFSGGQGHGTLRVRFSLCPIGQLSLIARSTGATFDSFPIAQYEMTEDQTNDVPDCCCCLISKCYAQLLKPIQYIHLVKEGNLGKGEMFDEAIKKSNCFTWAVRGGCYLLMVISIVLFFSPITILLGKIPLVGGIISGILLFAIILAAIIICIPIYIIVLSIAWLRYHPCVGVVILLIGLAILGIVIGINASKGGGGQSGGASHFLNLRYAHD